MGTSYSDKETINGEVTLGTDDGMIPRAVDLIFDRIKTYGKNYAFKVRNLMNGQSKQGYPTVKKNKIEFGF